MAPGYIAEYQEQIEELDDDYINELHGGLETPFSHCQCLPNSKFEGGSVIWEVQKGDVVLLGNPCFYELVSMGDAGRQKTCHAPTHTGYGALQQALLQLTGLLRKQARMTLNFQKTLTQVAAPNKKQSAHARNQHIPPTRRKQTGSADNLDDEEEDQPLDATLDDV
ncbi:hypothetical protein PILCRDRAFT_11055 [Piloderma croceum F 1598]|uniref:Uncharacterized protein n=1 Tax=Piloderma croceum (strain F 1598) TaxID=765440 RepID=A0A0C3BMT3_PILCF|nr:hypothetical protein PILCRDRAFT_11055 [Piloderma croceum F 1598]